MADYRALARLAARRYGLNPRIFERQIEAESGFQTGRTSGAGAQGIAQIMPKTAAAWGVDPNNPRQALYAAAKHMAQDVRKYGSYENALRAYNAGPAAIQRSHSYPETNAYVAKILRGGGGGGGGGEGLTAPAPTESALGNTASSVRTTTTPAVDNTLERLNLVQSFLGKRHADPIDFAVQAKALADVPAQTTRTVTGGGAAPTPGAGGGTTAPSTSDLGGRGNGVAKITGPNPGRIQPQVTNFMKEISAVRGGAPVVGSDGTGHSKYTVNGNVSEHFTGSASDIPAAGAQLMRLGRAALIAAGMPRSQAQRAPGGLYNLHKNGKRYQIIFNTQEGGDHTDHLHVGVSGSR